MTAFTRHSSGSSGLDSVLGGGFIRGRSYLLHGPAGSGKTILGFQFLGAGLAAGEDVLFVNLEEDLEDLRANAAALGFDVDAMEILDLSPGADVFTDDQSYSVFDADEVEQQPVSEAIVDLGPEGGEQGGEVVATGTPEEVARVEASHTGRYLRDLLPTVDLEGPRADRESAETETTGDIDGEGATEPDGEQATGAGDD